MLKKIKIEYSVRIMSISAFLFIMSVLLFGFLNFYKIADDNLKNYEQFVEMNKRANALNITIDRCEVYLTAFFNTGDERIYAHYKEISKEIEEALLELSDLGKKDRELIPYLDNPENNQSYQQVLYYQDMLLLMNDHHQELSADLKIKLENKEKVFKQIEYLTRYFNEMDKNTKIFNQAYFTLTGAIFDSYYEDSEDRGRKITFVVVILSTIGMIFVLDYLYRLLRNVRKLETAAKSLSSGNWDINDLETGRYREFNKVAEAFNEMRHAIVNYIAEMNEKAKLKIQLEKEKSIMAEKDKILNETKLLSLQMRMNPHFLFNTLNLIGSTAIHADIELATELVEAISDILRYNLEFDEKKVNLQEEIRVIEKYIFIQTSRWRERITFIVENNIENIDIEIPPMLLQPIIENAIIHGQKNVVENGIIKVKFYERDEQVVVEVFDNGEGIEDEKIRHIFDDCEVEEEKKRKSIGLKNIRKRLEIIFNRKDLLKVQRVEDGTLIEVSFPSERK